MSKSKLRQDPQATREFLEDVVGPGWKPAARLLAQGIELGAREAPDRWAVTLEPGRLVRLNVGWVAAATLWPDRLWIAVLASAAPPDFGIPRRRGFTMLPEKSYQYMIPLEELRSQAAKVKPAFLAFVRAASAAGGNNSTPSTREGHSTGVIEHLNDALDLRLPQPSHADATFSGRYWLLKMKRSWRGDVQSLEEIVERGGSGTWVTKRPPTEWRNGDRLFLWEGSPGSRLVALGQIAKIPPAKRREKGDYAEFGVEYSTDYIEGGPTLSDARADSIVADAYFTKSGPAQTLYPLDASQAAALYKLAVRSGPRFKVWADVFARHSRARADADADLREGARIERSMTTRERSDEAVRRCKQKYGTSCDVCGLDFAARYRVAGAAGFIHVHHLKPLARVDRARQARVEELRPVCPNCHAMLHTKDPPWTLSQLRAKLIRD